MDHLQHKLWCTKCKTDNVPLIKYSRVGLRQYYMCRKCQALRRRQWYQNGNQDKQNGYNKKYKIKKLKK